MRRIALSLVLLFAVLPRTAQAQAQDSDPRRTWVFVAGVLEWQDASEFEPFPKEERRDADLVHHFRRLGVPERQIVYLQDRAATGRAIRERLVALLQQARPGDTAYVYYCGHGYTGDDGRALLAGWDAGTSRGGVAMDEVPALVHRHFRGARAVLMVDACLSGAMAEAASRLRGGPALLVLASADARQTSTDRWTFTEAVLDALHGAPWTDADQDGRVEAFELTSFVTDEMMWAEDQIAGTFMAPSFPREMVLAATRPSAPAPIGERVGVVDEGETWAARVIGVDGKRLRVHFVGFPDSEDKWITRSELRKLERPRWAAGARVEVEEDGVWYPAHVLRVRGTAHLIHYDGYGSEYDEWVSTDRMRR